MMNRSPFLIVLAFLAMVVGAMSIPTSASAQDTGVNLERRHFARADEHQAHADAIRLRAVADLERARQQVRHAETERRIRFDDASIRQRLIESLAGCIGTEAQDQQWRCESIFQLVGTMYLAEPGPFADNPDYVSHNTAALAGAAWRMGYEAKQEATEARRATEELTLVTAEHLAALYGRTGELSTRVGAVEGRTGALESGLSQTRARLEATRRQTGESFRQSLQNDQAISAALEAQKQSLLEELQRRTTNP